MVIGSKACETTPKVEVIIKNNKMELELNNALQELSKYKEAKLKLMQ